MKTKKLNLKLLWMQFTDFLYPRLRLSITERAVYFYLLRHTRLEGKLQLHCSMPWLARGLGISSGPVRESVRRLAVLGALRIVQRSKAGHILEVRLPEEMLAANPGRPAVGSDVSVDDPLNSLAATLDPSINPDPLANSLPSVNLEKLDFLKTRALRNSIHLRERGHCFYCLRRTDTHTQCLDHVQPRVKAGCNSYRNLVSSCLECNSQKGEQSAADFFRSLYRDRRLTASEFQAGLRRLDALLAGKLPPPVLHPDTPVYPEQKRAVGTRTTSASSIHKACHSERSRPTFSPAFAPADASACAVEESLCPSTAPTHLIGRKGRPRRSLGQMIGLPAFSGDGYLATDAELAFLNATPYGAGLATDRSGNVFIADTANHAIRKVSASTGIITTVAGNGLIGFSGDGGPATSAQLFYPRDVAVDGSGNTYIVDSGNCVVRKITASTGMITTVAGTLPDSAGNYFCGFSGDGGPATSAQLNPIDLMIPAGGVAVDRSGNIFIADTGNGVIREVSASTGIITTVAGNANSIFVGGGDGGPATSATLFSPYGVAVDGAGNIFIADTYDFAIREVTAINGNIYTVAGNIALGIGFSGEGDGGPAGSAQLGYIFGVFLDPAGNLFIPDPRNCVIRQVSGSTGIISTVAGTPNRNGTFFCGFSGDGGPALSAVFDNPSAAGAGTSGNLVVLDNIRVRTVAGLVQGPAAGAVPFPDPLSFPSTPLATSNTLTVMLSDRGSLPTSVTTVAISGTNASDFSETDNCAGHSLAPGGGSCTINVRFTPPSRRHGDRTAHHH